MTGSGRSRSARALVLAMIQDIGPSSGGPFRLFVHSPRNAHRLCWGTLRSPAGEANGVGSCASAAQDSGPSVWTRSCIRVTNSLPPRRTEAADRGTRSKVKYAQANSANIEAMARRRRIGTPPDLLPARTGPATSAGCKPRARDQSPADQPATCSGARGCFGPGYTGSLEMMIDTGARRKCRLALQQIDVGYPDRSRSFGDQTLSCVWSRTTDARGYNASRGEISHCSLPDEPHTDVIRAI
jgi:hypothetical protein